MNRDLTGWDEETGEVLVLFLHDMLTTLEFIAVGRDRFYQASLRAFFWDGPDPDNRQEVVDYVDFLVAVIFGPQKFAEPIEGCYIWTEVYP